MSPATMMNTMSNPSMKVFVDTSAFLALLNVQDIYNAQASGQWRKLIENEALAFTNSYVLLETMAILQNRQGLGLVRNLQNELLPLLKVEWLDEILHHSAVQHLFAANRRQLSMVDCSCFETMNRLGVRKVFTFDPHFAEQGFEVIP